MEVHLASSSPLTLKLEKRIYHLEVFALRKLIFFAITHVAALAIGFAAGIYTLPILIAPDGPTAAQVTAKATNATYQATIREDLKGHDFLHWGKGAFSVSKDTITLMGELAPGPDYKLYLVPDFVEDEAGFEAIKDQSLRIGDVKSFENLILTVPAGTDIEAYNTVLVWCERFEEFITAAQYR